MNENSYYWSRMDFYALEPGDGTKYRFGILHLDPRWDDGVEVTGHFGHIFSGVGDGTGYVGLLIAMPSCQGFYELMIDAVRDPRRHLIGYVRGHMPGAQDNYTIAAILLALSVLVDDPADTVGACAAMLRAPELLKEM